MPTMSTLLSWDDAALATAAARVDGSVDEVEGICAELARLVAGARGPRWEGEAAAAAQDVGEQALTMARAISGSLDMQAEALRRCARALAAARDVVATGRQVAAQHHLAVLDNGRVPDPPPYLISSDAAPEVKIAAYDSFNSTLDAAARARALVQEGLAAAEEADRDCARALSEADRIGQALVGLGSRLGGFLGALDWPLGGLAQRAALLDAVQERDLPPPDASPERNRAWGETLAPAAREELHRTRPHEIGSLDGLPAAVRNIANREHVRRVIARLEAEIAEYQRNPPDLRTSPVPIGAAMGELAVYKRVQQQLDAGPDRFLLLVGTQDTGRAVIALGNPDYAAYVGVAVPGLNQDVAGDLQRTVRNAVRLKAEASAIGAANNQASSVSTVAWLGYETPIPRSVALEHRADAGAGPLTAFTDGLRVSRAAAGGEQQTITAVGHSYGSLVVAKSAEGDRMSMQSPSWAAPASGSVRCPTHCGDGST